MTTPLPNPERREFVFSANDILRTRLCAARDCANDSMTGHALCQSCVRLQAAGKVIALHEVEQPPPIDHDAVLSCTSCDEPKPDDEFSRSNSSRYRYRRYRHAECRDCAAKRRREDRRRNPVEKCIGIVTQDKYGKPLLEARRCQAWSREGTEYCVVHAKSQAASSNPQPERETA